VIGRGPFGWPELNAWVRVDPSGDGRKDINLHTPEGTLPAREHAASQHLDLDLDLQHRRRVGAARESHCPRHGETGRYGQVLVVGTVPIIIIIIICYVMLWCPFYR
jgi:hypothetical protein